jgi:hypothetical protein
LHCVAISPYYETGINTGTPAGQDGRQPSKKGRQSKRIREEIRAGQELLEQEMLAEMETN